MTNDVCPKESATSPARPKEASLTTLCDDHREAEDYVLTLDVRYQKGGDNGLLSFLISRGVALTGALAGMVLHASNDDQEQGKRRKASSKDLS